MFKYAIAIIAILTSTSLLADTDYRSEGTWQKYTRDCDIEEIHRGDSSAPVTKCRIRFKIADNECAFATIRYDSSIGSQLKRGRCRYDSETKLLVIKTRDSEQNYRESFSGYLAETLKHNAHDVLVVDQKETSRSLWFWKK